jgi:hypothetical protein
MNLEDGKTKPESQGGELGSEGGGPRKIYGPPRLRSLGQVNVITVSGPQMSGPEGSVRKKSLG